MSTLARQQQAMLAALWQPGHDAAMKTIAAYAQPERAAGLLLSERGLKAYRSNAALLAPRALAGAFPVLLQLLEEENFGHLARSYWQAFAPLRGDLAQWGGELAAHIESLPQLAGEPYLADVARAEWALHMLATAPDAQQDAASFALLATADPARITLQFSPAACVASAWPVASIIAAHLGGTPSLEEAGQRIRDNTAETALAWRQGFKPRLRLALPGEAVFIAALQDRASLLDSLARAPGLDFNQWLPAAAQQGLLLAAVPH
ncbi:MAG: putative DNA-binding domain-containing protein [Burkholderiales bacterium]|nr:putative DNA-binding domain-containing protein [Burkholderiales bacterium]